MAIAYVLDEIFTEHRPPRAHPERPERVTAVRDALRRGGLESRGEHLPTRRAEETELGTVHTAGYLSELTATLPGREGWLDPDTYYCPETWDAALAAAGAGVDLVRASLRGSHARGIGVVRPPGHHAEADRAMGFCLLNNIAIAAACAREEGAARVAILDWDVHHGNGTQNIFYRDPSVLYTSLHQYPFYPGTGAADERGEGEGLGATVNAPLAAGSGDAEYAAAMESIIVPALRQFRPDIVLVSAGYDAYRADPLAGMELSLAGFADMAARTVALADEVCQGRLVALLEGGYDLEGVSGGAMTLFEAMDARERGAG